MSQLFRWYWQLIYRPK